MITPNLRESQIGWFYWTLQLLVLPSVLVFISGKLPFSITEAQLNIAFFLINFLCVAVIFFRFLKASLEHLLKNAVFCLTTALIGFLLYYGAQLVVGLLITKVYPQFMNANDMSVQLMVQQAFLPMAFCTIFLVPITEEVLYRGLVMGSLHHKGKFLSYGVSTVIFCAIHVVGYVGFYPLGMLVLCFLQYVPAGLFLGWAYDRTQTVCTPILIHMAVNAMGILAMR